MLLSLFTYFFYTKIDYYPSQLDLNQYIYHLSSTTTYHKSSTISNYYLPLFSIQYGL